MGNEVTTTGDVDDRTRRTIWRYMGTMSAREIAAEVGLQPEEVLRIKHEMLDEVDALSNEQQRRKLLADLQEVASAAIEKSKNVFDERNYAPMLSASTQAMKMIMGELNRVDKGVEDRIERLNQKRIEVLFTIFDVTMNMSIPEIAKLTGYEDEEELFAVVSRNLPIAAAQVEAVQEQE